MEIKAERLTDAPILYPDMDARMGGNLNGPCLVRMPDWAAGKLGAYHLYFADHKGRYIRLAYADKLTGPWQMHEPGVLDLSQSLFEPEDLPPPPKEDWPEWAHDTGIEDYLYAHIASPSVIIDHENRQLVMYYHGLLPDLDQMTRVAFSDDGINFVPKAPLLGPSYFHVFTHDSVVYAVSLRGWLLRAESWIGPFERGPKLTPFDTPDSFGAGFRHGCGMVKGDTLHLFYSRIGDTPERILHARISITGPWTDWHATEASTLLSPERDWEGANLPLEASQPGGTEVRKRELRDPFVFRDDDGKAYMVYAGAGECAIGIATLHGM